MDRLTTRAHALHCSLELVKYIEWLEQQVTELKQQLARQRALPADTKTATAP